MTYNSWKNYETWNVALWIQNDEPLYRKAVSFVKWRKPRNLPMDYDRFTFFALVANDTTPDGVAYDDPTLDRAALTEMLQELVD